MIQAYKIVNSIDKFDVNTFFKMVTDTWTRDHNFMITKQQIRTMKELVCFHKVYSTHGMLYLRNVLTMTLLTSSSLLLTTLGNTTQIISTV